MAEIELQVLNGQCLNRHISTIEKIKDEVEAWQRNRNNKNSTINWQLTNKQARVKLKKLLKNGHFPYNAPEEEDNPYAVINSLLLKYKGRGIGRTSSGKIKLVTRLIDLGFDLKNSANHPQCFSAKYFLAKLQEIGRH